MQIDCPECGQKLHTGQHKFNDGLYEISYCKKCGYRKEEPISQTNF
ncbi:MAG TPA: zf-TFIIB domain-containing protein [Candidatus Nanoarchaeia archaeon]|nr:zf-TFIIB domain-containing protein [Candidatus Nanoarchaeia archaeon]